MEPRRAAAAGGPPASHPEPGKGAPPTQLQFNQNAPALPENLSTLFASPPPIIIEKVKQLEVPQRDKGAGDGLSPTSSLEFSAVSEEKLQRAVQLVKRDLKRQQLAEQLRQHLSWQEEGLARGPRGKGSGNTGLSKASQTRLKDEHPLSGRSKTETVGTRAKVYLSKVTQIKAEPSPSDSPPTRDPGPGPALVPQKEADKSACEVRRLQKELQSYVQKVEELAQKEKHERTLDPEEERRVHTRRQEQAARSARMLYVLQQQVKEIQEDLEKLSPHKTRHTKKSRAMARLAAAHRGAVRALQTFVSHFADRPEQPPALAHCRELGHLIRQLSLCSARLEMEPSIPDVVLDLLLQIEDLDLLLAKKASTRKASVGLSVPPKGPLRLPRREKKACPSEPRKPLVARKLLPDVPPETDQALAQNGRSGECDGGGPVEDGPLPKSEASVRDRGEARAELEKTRGPGTEGAPLRRKGAVLLPARPQGRSRPFRRKWGVQPPGRQARFQEPTVSFRLKETKPPVQESRIPWVPPSHTSPLASPRRHPERSPRSKEASLEREAAGEGRHGTPKRKEAPRSGGISPTQVAEKVEREVQEWLEPLLAKAQQVNLSVERKVGPEGSLGAPQLLPQEAWKAAGGGVLGSNLAGSADLEQHKKTDQAALLALGTSDLGGMLQRMEEIERSEEAVRRRYHQMVYSDIEFCLREERRGREGATGGPEPGSPAPPIQISRLESHQEPQADIVLERPSDTNAVEWGEEEDEVPPPWRGAEQPPGSRLPLRKGAGTFLSVPQSLLRSISDYRARYDQHLQRISHEAVGNFNPWHIAQSLAEELAEVALAEVGAELQGLCEEYAEAVFTAEFLQASAAE